MSRKSGISILAAGLLAAAPAPARGAGVDFNRDVRPILSDKCFQCHGPDAAAREAELRLDERDAALADLGGYAAIAPGRAGDSEMIALSRLLAAGNVAPSFDPMAPRAAGRQRAVVVRVPSIELPWRAFSRQRRPDSQPRQPQGV